MITDSDIKALFRACTSQTSSSSPTTLEVPSPPPYFELLSGIGIILESSAKEEIEKRIVCSGGDGRCLPEAILSLDPYMLYPVSP